MRNRKVAAAIARAQAERAKRVGVSQDRVVEELARLAFSDLREVASFGPSGVELKESEELSADVAASVAEAVETPQGESGSTVRVKLWDKLRALELLGKHLGMFVERGEHQHRHEIEIVEVVRAKPKRGK